MRYLFYLFLTTKLLFSQATGFLALGAGYTQELYRDEDDAFAPAIFAIVRDGAYSLEGNRFSIGLGSFYDLQIASITRVQDTLFDTGLQLTLPLIADLRFQINTLFNVEQNGFAVEGMLFRRFKLGDLEMIPSLAYEYDSARHFDAAFDVHEKGVNFEFELLTIYDMDEKYNLVNTIFYNRYDEKVLLNSRIDRRDIWRTTLAIGYRF